MAGSVEGKCWTNKRKKASTRNGTRVHEGLLSAFEKCPLYPSRFDILKIESKKKEKFSMRPHGVPFFFWGKIWGQGSPVRAMSEKKTASEAAENKAAAKKSAKKKSAKRATKETNAADVRKKVSKMVKAKAVQLAEAVIGKTDDEVPEDLQLATVKYMFEVAEIYPPQADQDAATADEDCLAKTLLTG
jgi:hypothetical protein